MSDQVYWILEVAIKPGQMGAFRDLMGEMVEATHANEPDTLNYEWTLSADESVCHIYERYRNSAAVMAHLGWFGANVAERFLAAVEPKKLTVYGAPDETAVKALNGLGAVYMAPFGGFVR